MITDNLSKTLCIRRGITAVIGSGGKTTLLRELARELSACGSVILTTSTHIRPFPDLPCLASFSPDSSENEAVIRSRLSVSPLLCIGTPAKEGKLSAPPLPFDHLARLADYVLIEADGSRGLPIKAHRGSEPVIPDGTRRIILLAGFSGFGKPVRNAVHVPERFLALTGAGEQDLLTPELCAEAIQKEHLADVIVLNQADDLHCPDSALRTETLSLCRRFAKKTDLPVFAGSLREHFLIRIDRET